MRHDAIESRQSAEAHLQILADTVDAEICRADKNGAHRAHQAWLADLREALLEKRAELASAAAWDGIADPRPLLFKLMVWLENFHIAVQAALEDPAAVVATTPLPEPTLA